MPVSGVRLARSRSAAGERVVRLGVPLLDEYLTGSRARARGLFDPGTVERLVGEHSAGINHSERLWALLTFEIWARVFLDGEAPWSLALPLRHAA